MTITHALQDARFLTVRQGNRCTIPIVIVIESGKEEERKLDFLPHFLHRPYL